MAGKDDEKNFKMIEASQRRHKRIIEVQVPVKVKLNFLESNLERDGIEESLLRSPLCN